MHSNLEACIDRLTEDNVRQLFVDVVAGLIYGTYSAHSFLQ